MKIAIALAFLAFSGAALADIYPPHTPQVADIYPPHPPQVADIYPPYPPQMA